MNTNVLFLVFLNIFCVFFCFVSLRPSQQRWSWGMVSSELHLTTLFSWASYQLFEHILSLVTDNNPSLISGREENDLRNKLMINFTTVWDRAGIKHVTPGSAVRRESVLVRNVTDCAFLWHDDGKMEFNTTKLYFIYWLIFLTLIELLHETPVFSCINHKQITLLQKWINHYHQCKKCRIIVLVPPSPTLLWVLEETVSMRRFFWTPKTNI